MEFQNALLKIDTPVPLPSAGKPVANLVNFDWLFGSHAYWKVLNAILLLRGNTKYGIFDREYLFGFRISGYTCMYFKVLIYECLIMNQKSQKKMDKKKSKTGKRRKSNTGKRHGRAEQEEKPETAEVMNEKEKQDRLEAANVLSSLRFFPPKSSEDNENLESGAQSDLVTPSSSVTQISLQPTTSGIPGTSQPTSLVLGGRGSPATAAVSENAANLKNSMILAQLQNQLSLALKSKNVHPVLQSQTHPAFAQNNPLTVRPGFNSKFATNDKSDSQNLPLTVIKQNLTINKNVAKALRQAVSNNKIKAEFPAAENLQEKTNDKVPAASNNEQERMDCESLPSSRKAGGTDNNLPLKKRRLIGMSDESLTTSDLNLNSNALSTNLDTLASARQIENILQMAKDYPASSADSALSLVTSLTQTKVQEGKRILKILHAPNHPF